MLATIRRLDEDHTVRQVVRFAGRGIWLHDRLGVSLPVLACTTPAGQALLSCRLRPPRPGQSSEACLAYPELALGAVLPACRYETDDRPVLKPVVVQHARVQPHSVARTCEVHLYVPD
jgi:hypothetical protein